MREEQFRLVDIGVWRVPFEHQVNQAHLHQGFERFTLVGWVEPNMMVWWVFSRRIHFQRTQTAASTIGRWRRPTFTLRDFDPPYHESFRIGDPFRNEMTAAPLMGAMMFVYCKVTNFILLASRLTCSGSWFKSPRKGGRYWIHLQAAQPPGWRLH